MKYDDYEKQPEEMNTEKDVHEDIENQNQITNEQAPEVNSNEQIEKDNNDYTENQANQQQSFEDNKSNHKQPRKKNQKRHFGMSAIIGGISGSVITALTLIVLLTNNIISFGDQPNEQATSNQSADSTTVASQVADNDIVGETVGDASKAVVGVSRLQQQNIWEPDEETGTGSGIIYKKENGKAYVVTNHHVVDGAQGVEVTLSNDEQIKAKVLGSDDLADLAVLEIDGSKIENVANLGSSEDIEVGETVIAIGNPLGKEFSNSLTKGIISGVNRSVDVDTNGDNQPDWVTEVLQTDAAINPGNSGGALVNADGQVIGINSMKIAQQAVEGIGFAIPIDSAKPIIEQLETKGEIARPYIGVSAVSLEEVPMQYQENITLPKEASNGLVVANVEQGSPAAKAGLQQYDVITKINGEQLTSFLDLRKFLYSEVDIDQKVKVEYYHEGKKQTAELKLAERNVE